MIPEIQTSSLSAATVESRQGEAKEVAKNLEAAFLAQMLTIAGVGKPPDSFGGGVGEGQFSSFLVQEFATKIAASGGIGLAEHIYNAMLDAEK